MNKELCFKINSNELYLEKVLVTHNDIPMYFICIDSSLNYYVVLFTDIDEDRYIITKTNVNKIIELFKRHITMKELIIHSDTKKYWEIIASSDDINNDCIIEKDITSIPVEDLPSENSYFNLTEKSNEDFFNKLLKLSKQTPTSYETNSDNKMFIYNFDYKMFIYNSDNKMFIYNSDYKYSLAA